MLSDFLDWKTIEENKITALEYPACDRQFVFKFISANIENNSLYYWNTSCKELNKFVDNTLEPLSDYPVKTLEEALSLACSLEGILIIGGFGDLDSKLICQLENLYFDLTVKCKLILADNLVNIPEKIYPIVPKLKVKLPTIPQIKDFLGEKEFSERQYSDFVGLSYGEIDLMKNKSSDQLLAYKTAKLSSKGLRITPEADVEKIGGLDLLMRDLNKIKKLFLPAAYERGLRPPKGCLLWGLPGTGKSLTAKMLSRILKVPLISCNWNQLVGSTLSESLQNIDLVFQLVDSVGNCVIFFDEFEKAFTGFDSGEAGGVMAKMAGQLLSWMQDHTSPSIMVATINRLEKLPPELVRRFQYVWFFDVDLHNGAMWEIFKVHLAKHFPGYQEQISDTSWYRLFATYRSCSPDEIAKAIDRVHHEIFYQDFHVELDIETLISFLISERENFKPAVSDRLISDQLAKIRRTADYARPVQGVDRSRFAEPQVALFEGAKSKLPANYTLAI